MMFWFVKVRTCRPVATSQTRTTRSNPTEIAVLPSEVKTTSRTVFVCPRNTRWSYTTTSRGSGSGCSRTFPPNSLTTAVRPSGVTAKPTDPGCEASGATIALPVSMSHTASPP